MKTSKTKKARSAKEEVFSFKDLFMQIAGSFLGNFLEQLQESVMEKTREILFEVKRTITMTVLIILGVVFLFIGMANLIDFVVGIKGVGYLFIGFIVMFFGFFINMLTRRK